MNKLVISVLMILFLTTVGYAAEMTPEAGCCMDFQRGLQLREQCDQYEMTQERCDRILDRYWAVSYAPLFIPVAILVIFLFIAWLIWHRRKK